MECEVQSNFSMSDENLTDQELLGDKDATLSEFGAEQDLVAPMYPGNSESLNQNTVPSGEQLKSLASALTKANSGDIITLHRDLSAQEYLFYVRAPSLPSMTYVSPGVIIPKDSSLLCKLCELNDNRLGLGSVWNCQVKDEGRLRARCRFSGRPKKTRSSGLRVKASKKLGCSALVLTSSLQNFFSKKFSSNVLEQIREEWGLFNERPDALNELDCDDFCVVKIVQVTHTNHIPDGILDGRSLIARSGDLIGNETIMSALKSFRSVCPKGRGSIVKLHRFLEDRFPEYSINEEALQNTLKIITDNEDDAQKLVNFMKEERQKGNLEFLDFELEETGVLFSITWASRGSKEVVKRCGDVMFWDSTHNATRYNYRFVTHTIVDSECVSRAVLLSLTLKENVEYCKRFLACWHEAFGVRLPPVIFTGGDDAMALAIDSVPYRDEMRHLLCIFHLFDMNVKKRVLSLLTSKSGASSWPSFRSALSLCRECGSEGELSGLWNQLMKKWFPPGTRTRKARQYLGNHVWQKRRQWATTYFKEYLIKTVELLALCSLVTQGVQFMYLNFQHSPSTCAPCQAEGQSLQKT